MTTMKKWARVGVLALGAVSGLAMAQVRGGLINIQPIPIAKYYQATDLGRVAEGKPVGCLSRGGTVAVTRYRYEAAAGRWVAQAVRPDGNPEFAFYFIQSFDSWVSGCNDNNEFVGVSLGHGGGVIWDIDWNSAQRLGSTVVGPNQPQAISPTRTVVGASTDSLALSTATAWITSTLPNDNTLTSKNLGNGVATGINANAVASITSFVGQPAQRRAGLSGLQGGVPFYPILPGATSSWANGIDDQSRLVGGTQDAGGTVRGFVWNMGEGYAQLQPTWDGQGMLPHAEARAIGLDRFVVGQSYAMVAGQPVRPAATVWVAAAGPRNLNRESSMSDGSAPPQLTDAVAVSHTGAILCEARASDGTRHAVLLTPRSGGRWNLIP